MKYKSIINLLRVNLVLLFSLFLSLSSLQASVPLKEWTFMLFMAGDNNLEGGTSVDINELERYGSSSKVNFVAQIDRNGSFSEESELKWSGTKRFYIKKDNKPKKMTSPMVQDLGEVDMSKPKALVDFVKWSKKHYPAKKYALILWNHGTGWKEIQPSIMEIPEEQVNLGNSGIGSSIDNISYNISYDSTSHDSMNIPTLYETLMRVKKILGKPIDLLGFDACLMQMAEVANAASSAALYQVGSPDQEPERGWPYDMVAKALIKNPRMDARKLGVVIVDAYKKSYNGGQQGNKSVVLSLLNLSKMASFKAKLDTFCTSFRRNLRDISKFEQARAKALKYTYSDYIDLGNFLSLIIRTNVNSEIKHAANILRLAITDKSLKDSFVVKVGKTGAKFQQSTGLAIFFPERNGFNLYSSRYKLLSFATNTEWFDFIREVASPNMAYVKIEEIIFTDANQDGRIAPGETVTVSLVVNNFGRKALVAPLISATTRSKHLNKRFFRTKPKLKIPPGRHKIKVAFRFTVKKNTSVHTKIPITVTLSGHNVPISSVKSSFLVKKSFASTSHALLVLNDAFSPASPVIQSMFQSANIKFDTWDRALDGEIKSAVLTRYLKGWVFIVVQDSSQALTKSEVAALTSFLKSGGRLVLDGQDISFSLRDTDFLEKMCRAKFIQDDVNVHVVNGFNNFAGNGNFQIFGGDGANNQKWPDEIDPLQGATPIVKYDENSRDIADESEMVGPDIKPDSLSKGIKSSGVAAVAVAKGYRLLLFTFGVEAINNKIQRNKVMRSIAKFMQPDISSEINNYASVSLDSAITRDITKIDMLANVENRLFNEIKNKSEANTSIAENALRAIKQLPANKQEAVIGLEKNIRTLLEFKRGHGNLGRR